MCAPWDVACVAGEAASGLIGDAISSMADAVLEALGTALASLGTMWVGVSTPNLTTTAGGTQASDPVAFLQGSLWWYMAAAAILAVIVGGARMAWEQRGEPGRELVKGLLTLTVVSGAGLTGIGLAVTAADGFSEWILDRSTEGTDFGQNIVTMIGLSTATAPGLGPLIVVILGLIAILSSFLQIMLMVVRGGMLVILAGVFPLSSSFTSTEMGRAWFKRCIAWLIAFTLYKPAAAVVYATAFRLTGSDVFGDDGLTGVLTGVVLMILALLALPALMRFVIPMVSATAGGGGGAAIAAGAAAALPSGAIALSGRGNRGGGSGSAAGQSGGPSPAGASGPTGPSGSDGTGGGRGRTGGGGPSGSNGSGGSAPVGGGATAGAGAGTSNTSISTKAAGTAGGGAAAAGGGAASAGAQVAVGAGKAAAGAARQAADDSSGGADGNSR